LFQINYVHGSIFTCQEATPQERPRPAFFECKQSIFRTVVYLKTFKLWCSRRKRKQSLQWHFFARPVLPDRLISHPHHVRTRWYDLRPSFQFRASQLGAEENSKFLRVLFFFFLTSNFLFFVRSGDEKLFYRILGVSSDKDFVQAVDSYAEDKQNLTAVSHKVRQRAFHFFLPLFFFFFFFFFLATKGRTSIFTARYCKP
jgi:hypothetical protein